MRECLSTVSDALYVRVKRLVSFHFISLSNRRIKKKAARSTSLLPLSLSFSLSLSLSLSIELVFDHVHGFEIDAGVPLAVWVLFWFFSFAKLK